MSASKAAQSIIGVLKGIPAGLIGPDRIGFSGPAQATDLPLVAVALGPVREPPIGIGGTAGLAFDGAQWIASTGTRISGQLRVEMWTAGVVQMNALVDGVLAFLEDSTAALHANGFTAFQTAAIRATEGLLLADQTPALHATLEYSIVHEDVTTLTTGAGGIIREIDVAIDGQFDENMIVKQET